MRLYQINEKIQTIDAATPNDVIERLKKETPIAWQNFLDDNIIWRGFRNLSEDFSYVTPMENRVSANTANYYTLLIDEILPSWQEQDWPKRSESFICVNDREHASGYAKMGEPMAMFPIGNPKIGIVPDLDMWDGFDFDEFSSDTQNLINHLADLNNLIQDNYSRFFDEKMRDKRLEAFVEDFKKFNEKIMNMTPKETREYMPEGTYSSPLEKLVELSHKYGGLLTLLDHTLDPERNGFELTDLKNFSPSGEHEVWYSAPSYTVSDQMIEAVQEEMGL